MPPTLSADLTAEEMWLAFVDQRPERGPLDLFDFVRRYGDLQTALLMAVEEAGAEGMFRRFLDLILAGKSTSEAIDEIDGRG